MHEIKPIQIKSYLSHEQIEAQLKNVDYIVMAAPSMMPPPALPIHFTIILNTAEPIPEEIKPMIVDKFCRELAISATSHMMFETGRVAFAMTSQDTPMPRHLFDPAEASAIPWVALQVIDFLGESNGFEEAKNGLNGWSYNYN